MTENEFAHPLRPFLKNWLWEHGRVGFSTISRGRLPPCSWFNFGLGSNRSSCDGAPAMNRKMHALARGSPTLENPAGAAGAARSP